MAVDTSPTRRHTHDAALTDVQHLDDLTFAELRGRVTGLVALVTQLEHALDSQVQIEQTKGILMAVHLVSGDEAFAMLRAESQTSNRKLTRVAQDFLAVHTARPG